MALSGVAVSGTGAQRLKITDVYHHGVQGGLSSERVFSILEDSDGVIWIGTKLGVDRFNGREFRPYNLEDDFYYGDFAARVIKLLRNGNGDLLAYDNTGRIYRYSAGLDRFEVLVRLSDHIKGNIVLNKVLAMTDGSFLLGLTSGLYRISDGEVSEVIPQINVNDIAFRGDTIYIATTGGIVVTDGNIRYEVFNGNNVQTVCHDSERDILLIGTFNNGLWGFDCVSQSIFKISKNGNAFDKPIRAMQKLDNACYAVGIDGNGVYGYEVQKDSTFLLIDTNDATRISLKGNGVYTLMQDHYGNLWVGGYTGGVASVLFTHFPVTHIMHEPGNSNSICDNNVNAVAEDTNGEIWYATDRGISIQNPALGKWRHLNPGSVVVTLLNIGEGVMAAGTYGDGIYIIDRKGDIRRHINRRTDVVKSNYIFSIKKDLSGEYWAASLDGGVMRFDKNFQYKHTYPVDVVFSIAISPEGKIATATADGFYMIDPVTDRIESFCSLEEQMGVNTSVYIVSILFHPDGTVWLGTEGGGVNVYDIATRKIIKSFKSGQGLPSNDVYSMLQDGAGNIVVGTGNGLAMFKDSLFVSMNFMHGVGKEYNKSSCVLLQNGRMVFGSVAGAVHVDPTTVGPARHRAVLRIARLDVEGWTDKGDTLFVSNLRKQLSEGEIGLSYLQNSFVVGFEAINLPYQKDIAYSYILEGYDKEWSEMSSAGYAPYKNVAPGDYKFRVRALRFCDGAVLDEKEISIDVGHPWWQSWWAVTAYCLLAGLLVCFVFRYKWYRLQKHYDENKIRFFVNTAHDIRTPVSLVMAPISDLKKDSSLSAGAQELISIAEANIRKLNAVTTELLEFERFDTGRRKINLVTIDLAELLAVEAQCFRDAFTRKGIDFSVCLPEGAACMKGDRYLLEIMLDNLLSNACKYTGCRGKVVVNLTAMKRKLHLEVSDNGMGIPQTDHKHIFTDVHRAQNARESNEGGTGFGLLQVKRIVELLKGSIRFTSKEGAGTTFHVTFKRAFSKAEPMSEPVRRRLSLDGLLTFASTEPVGDDGHPDTLLVVEDNDDMRHYLAKSFSDTYNVATCRSAQEAMEYLKGHYPDIIISDVMMPGMPGDDFCRAVKSNPETAGIPVILLTAKLGHDAVVAGLTKGADDYVAKPFSTDILKLKVKGLLENRERQRAHLLRQAVGRAVDTHVDEVGSVMQDDSDGVGAPEVKNESDRDFVDKVTKVVLAHIPDMDFSIEGLCREMAMSRTLLYGRLKSLTGKAPQEFIRLLRLERAASMLRSGYGVTEVAEATGFVNAKYFSTLFKKHFGVQPSRFVD